MSPDTVLANVFVSPVTVEVTALPAAATVVPSTPVVRVTVPAIVWGGFAQLAPEQPDTFGGAPIAGTCDWLAWPGFETRSTGRTVFVEATKTGPALEPTAVVPAV
jgi:hypothetical protein